MNKIKLKKQKGITLIALVVTIVILIILASVAITMSLSDRGLLSRTKQAKEDMKYAEAKDIIELKIIDIQIATYNSTKAYPTIKQIADNLCEDNDIEYIEETSQIIASLLKNIPEDAAKIFLKLKKYPYEFEIEKKDNSVQINGNKLDDKKQIIKVSLDVLNDVNQFAETIVDDKKCDYIINNPDIFMDIILQNNDLMNILFSNTNAMNKIIANDTWRNKILTCTEDISGSKTATINALDNSNPRLLPKTDLIPYDSSTGIGNVLYSSWLRNADYHSPVYAFTGGTPGYNDWESEATGMPQYIGFDYGDGNEAWVYKVYFKPGNNSYPQEMYLQSSNDNINWKNVYKFTKYVSACSSSTEVINSDENNSKARYWRLYITKSSVGSYIDFLKFEFYAK